MRSAHIGIGIVGLLVFWIPIFAQKGGARHVFYGRLFSWICYGVLASAALAVALHMYEFWQRGIGPRQAPAIFSLYLFLGYLTLTTFAIITHGRGAAWARDDTPSLRAPWRITISTLPILGSLGLIAYAFHFRPPTFWVLLAISIFGIFASYDAISHMLKARATRQEWVYQHLNGMIGTGIAFYTAFVAFGARVAIDFDTLAQSGFNVIPWLAPAAIGIPFTMYWKRQVMRRYSDR